MLAAFHHHLVEVPFISTSRQHTCSSPDATLHAIQDLAVTGGIQVQAKLVLDNGAVVLIDKDTQHAESASASAWALAFTAISHHT